jgi:hypothetical protein
MDLGEQHRIANLLKIIVDTERWLEVEVLPTASSPRVEGLADTLHRYLQHCRRQVWAGHNSPAAIDRRKRKIEESCFALWQIMLSKK